MSEQRPNPYEAPACQGFSKVSVSPNTYSDGSDQPPSPLESGASISISTVERDARKNGARPLPRALDG